MILSKPKVFISACLTGQAVRYDGKDKLVDRLDILSDVFSLQMLCPEMSIGLGVPRPPIYLMEGPDGVTRVISTTDHQTDHATALTDAARDFVKTYPELSGAIGVSRSPSCGLSSSRTFSHTDRVQPMHQRGTGQFVKTLLQSKSAIPVIENELLEEPLSMLAFIGRVHAYAWSQASLMSSERNEHGFVDSFIVWSDRYSGAVQPNEISDHSQGQRALNQEFADSLVSNIWGDAPPTWHWVNKCRTFVEKHIV